MNASPFFDARGLCLCIQSVGHRVLAVAVGGAAGQGQRQGIFAGGQKPRQREFVRRPEGDAHQQNAGACRTAQAFVQQLLQDTTPALDVLRANFK